VLESAELKLIASAAASSMQVRKLKLSDLVESLRSGWDDFRAYPSYAVMLAIIYPIVGLLIARALHGYSFLPLLFPLAAGFALRFEMRRINARPGIPDGHEEARVTSPTPSCLMRVSYPLPRSQGRTTANQSRLCPIIGSVAILAIVK